MSGRRIQELGWGGGSCDFCTDVLLYTISMASTALSSILLGI
jgi:hypothetical protein